MQSISTRFVTIFKEFFGRRGVVINAVFVNRGGGAPARQVARSGILKGHVLARWPRHIGPVGLNLMGGRLVSVIQRKPTSTNCGGEFSQQGGAGGEGGAEAGGGGGGAQGGA